MKAHRKLSRGVLWIMARGGFVQVPDGSVVVALTLPLPLPVRRAGSGTQSHEAAVRGPAAGDRARHTRVGGPFDGGWEPDRRRWSAHADEPHTVRAADPRSGGDEPRVRVLVHAGNRARALTRLRNLGMRSVYLRGNTEPPTADEITAVLHHPDGLVWRAIPEDDREPWQPIGALLHPSGRVRTA